MFRGANAINLDSKGRLTIPSKNRHALLDDCSGQLICTIDTQQTCLLLYPLTEWEEIEVKLARFSSTIPQERRMIRMLLGYASEVEMDKAGRILLSPELRQHAKIEKEAMLIGQLNKFELWDKATWYQQLEQDLQAEQSGDFELTERLREFSL